LIRRNEKRKEKEKSKISEILLFKILNNNKLRVEKIVNFGKNAFKGT